MINAKEFRIGNYARDEVSKEWMVVDEIGANVGAVLVNRDKYPLPDGWQMEYIPLTPEIFDKAGFSISLGGYKKLGFKLSLFHNGYKGADPDSFICQYNKTEEEFCTIKYLHQLQNLYFALTGEELNIQL